MWIEFERKIKIKNSFHSSRCVCAERATWIRKHIKMGPHRRQLSSILRIGNGIVPFAFASYSLLLCSTNARMSNTCDSQQQQNISKLTLSPSRQDRRVWIFFPFGSCFSDSPYISNSSSYMKCDRFAAENRILVFCRCRHINKLRARTISQYVYGFMHSKAHLLIWINTWVSGLRLQYFFHFLCEFSVTTRWRTTYVLIRDCFHSSRENNNLRAHRRW